MSKDTIYREDAIKVVRHASMEFVDADTRQKLIEAVPSADRPSDPHNITYINALKNRIRELEAKRPQGEWIDAEIPLESGGSMPIQACNLCKTFYPLAYTGGGHRFCPNCGCELKGTDDDC